MWVAEEIPLFPLNTVLFPGMPLPLHIFEPRYREMIGACVREERPFGVVLIKEGREVGAPATPFDVGTMARIVGVERLDDGRMNVVTVGTDRFRLLHYSSEKQSYIVADVEPLTDDADVTAATSAEQLAKEVTPLIQRYVAMVQVASEQDLSPLELPNEPEGVSFVVGSALRIRNSERQRLLELTSTVTRLSEEKKILERECQTVEQILKARHAGNLGPFSRN
ncbi:MAG: uncharacterized protein QOF51_1637 [Chloroflexota bacterium]|jgi:Lon protease-like protein|nr:uncharacterized protein [Chloroflexota bacterium]